MSLLLYAMAFWIVAFISTYLQDKYPDAAVASYQTVVKVIPTLLALVFVFITTPAGQLFYVIGIALFFCALGDVAMEKDIVPGIGMFLLAHLFLTGYFILNAISFALDLTNMIISTVCFSGFVVFVFMYIRFLNSSGPEIPDFVLKAGSFYFILISATLSTSLLLWLTTGTYLGILPVVGALFFIISDSIIALNEFRRKLAHPEYLIMPTYYLAIFLLSLSIFAFGL